MSARGVLIFLLGVLALLIFIVPQAAHGAVGTGGGASGSGGGAYTRNGWGWYRYSVDGNPQPYWFRDGSTKWANVSQLCKNDGADQVVAFIVLTTDISGTEGQRGVVYKYVWDDYFNPQLRQYRGNNGGNWLTEPDARARYDSLPAADKANFTWGDNVAWFCYDSTPDNWAISAASSAKVGGTPVTSAKPDDVIRWTHTLTNNGPDPTSANVHSNLLLSGFTTPSDWVTEPPGEWSAGNNGAGTAAGTMRTLTDYADYRVVQDDVGKTLCEKVRYDRTSGTDDTDSAGNNSCVTIPYNYTLTPIVSTDLSGVIEPNASVNVTPSVANTGPTKSQSTQWQLTQMIVRPGKTLLNKDTGGTSAGGPCGTFYGAAPDVTCSTIKSDSTVFSAIGGALGAETVAVGDLAVGTQVCFAFSVQPYSSGSGEWRHSVAVCLIVGKKPKVQIHGGDLMVGRVFNGVPLPSENVQTSISTNVNGGTKNTFGSWIEYGIFATGTISGAGSGSGYAGPTGLAGELGCNPYRLSFTKNNNTCTALGGYKSAKLIPNVVARFPESPTDKQLNATLVANSLVPENEPGTVVGNSDGDLILKASTLAPGNSVILRVKGTVIIEGNQTYDFDNKGAKYTKIGDLPQLVIIANKIIINKDVTNIDAWLIANGVDGIIETCNVDSSSYILSEAKKLSSKDCDKTLTVNGPVMAKQLWLRRTAGSGVGAASGDPAEIFNLRPDAYLWAMTRASGNSRVQTVYTTELPPRL